jgi:hypothetical protein
MEQEYINVIWFGLATLSMLAILWIMIALDNNKKK